jgi:hypothetical protein
MLWSIKLVCVPVKSLGQSLMFEGVVIGLALKVARHRASLLPQIISNE